MIHVEITSDKRTEGKTTVAKLLYDLLVRLGFDVEYESYDQGPEQRVRKREFEERLVQHDPVRYDRLKSRKVVITDVTDLSNEEVFRMS